MSVEGKNSKAKMIKLICEKLNGELKDEACIIYCLTPAECNDTCALLVEQNIQCVCYHGSLCPDEKITNMKKWQQNIVKVIVATKSLGMGIDKSDVRGIFHVSIPSSLHEYFQQIGRAGRDGKNSQSILFYRFQDRSLHLAHIFKCETEEGRRNGLRELKAVVKFCTLSGCYKSQLLKFFGEDCYISCKSMCANCLSHKDITEEDFTNHACNLILILQSLIPKVTNVLFSLIAKVYKGSKEKDLLEKKFNELPLYGSGKHLSLHAIEAMLVHLWVKNVIDEQLNKNLKSTQLIPTGKAGEVLAGSLKLYKC